MIGRLILESPILLFVVWLVVEAGIVAVWSARRTRGTARAVWIGLVVLAVLETANLLIVTPREKVIGVCRSMAESVERGDAAAVAAHLHVEFEAVGLDRAAFLDAVARTLGQFEVADASLQQFEVTFPDAETAVAEFTASCFVTSPLFSTQRLLSRWRATFRLDGGAGRMTTVDAIPTAFSPIRSLRDVLR
jgi:hypothetical protein